MDKKPLSNETRLAFSCAKVEMGEADLQTAAILLKKPLNWGALTEISLYHETLPILYYNLAKIGADGIPQNIQKLFQASYETTRRRNLLLWEEFIFLRDKLGESGLEIIPLKGIILQKTLYRDAGLRPMRDIDILVREDALRHCEKIIIQLGYRKHLKRLPEKYWRASQHHFNFYHHEKNVMLELHWKISPLQPKNVRLEEIWGRAKKKEVDLQKILSLSPEDTLLFLWLHLGKNITSLCGLRMKNLCDIHEMIQQNRRDLDWDYILNKTKEWEIKNTFLFLRGATKEYLNTPWPEYAGITPPGEKPPRIPGAELKPISKIQSAFLMLAISDNLRTRLNLIGRWLLAFCRKINPLFYISSSGR
ncbi:MAG: nucleotidyltransferase family protein [Candidatus Omnitrophica bacterium]|jgi:hypothetical protein|nr:nucleotidyltransferase family protein [Candidatus Omnitrophota bacterium]MDD3274573.1 nucleotidyltransferase family protein [Candidatus Omnitrophota bacterium]MDD5078212.1 nucleotidyltransferase family protein [Candidatus Omnitrophota bacterium]MDD5724735.1 nucleotidyltransferase family protein [Candidatus Omnitrophota bacterium]